MKDQKELLKKCLVNDIPAIVFQGSDSCAVEILQAAENIYRKNGCSPEFLIDFHENVVENFRAYQLENSIATKLPDLTTSEKEAFYILQEKEEAYFPIHIKDFEQHLKDYGFTRTYENTTSYGKYLLLKEKDYIGITGNNGNYDFAINYSKESNQISYFVFSDDPNYPERIGDYNSLKTCFSDIMSRHPLKEEKNELFTVIENYHQMGYDDISQIQTVHALPPERPPYKNPNQYHTKYNGTRRNDLIFLKTALRCHTLYQEQHQLLPFLLKNRLFR